MSFFGWGPNSVESSQLGLVTNPTTATLLAEVDLNSSMVHVKAGGQTFGVTWILSVPTTVATFLCDHALSTGVASTGIRNQIAAPLSSNQTIQLFTKHHVQSTQQTTAAAGQGDRFRVRLASSFTGSAGAKIIVEPLV